MSFGSPVRNGLGIGLTPSTALSSGRVGGRPAMFLNFVGATALSSNVTFTRASTATFTGSNGLIQTAAINGPRFDYDPVTLAAKGLLVEEQRTNLLVRSEEFDNAAWVKAGATISANATTSPDGTTTADRLVEDTSNGGHYASYQTAAVTSGTAYTLSVCVKAAGRTWARLAFATAFTTSHTWFNLATGTVGTVGATSASITNLGNGWYRLSATQTATSTTNAQLFIAAEISGSSTSYTGNGTDGIFIYGAQLEAGAFATSYIPTVASQVTRSADVATMTGTNFSSWYNQSAGTFVGSFGSAPVNNIAQQALYVSDGTGNNAIVMRRNTTGFLATAVIAGGVNQGDIASGNAIAGGAIYNFAFAYATNDLAESVNGAAVATDTSASIPTVNQINLGLTVAGIQSLNGHIRQIAYYNTRLPNDTLQALTS